MLYEAGARRSIRSGRRDHGAAPFARGTARAATSTTASSDCFPIGEKVRRADYHYRNVGSEDDLDAWVAGVMAELRGELE